MSKRDEFKYYEDLIWDLFSHGCNGLGLEMIVKSWGGCDFDIDIGPNSVICVFEERLTRTGPASIGFIYQPGEFRVYFQEKEITKQFMSELTEAQQNVLVDLMRMMYCYSRRETEVSK